MEAQEIIRVLQLLPKDPLTVGKVALALMGESAPTQPCYTGTPLSMPVSNLATVPATPQSQVISPGSVMIPAGFLCECDQCHKTVYRIIYNVFENMSKKDFVGCFEPLGDAPVLKMPLDTWADHDGNLAIDCPLCKGTKSLWIKGKGSLPFSDVPEGST